MDGSARSYAIPAPKIFIVITVISTTVVLMDTKIRLHKLAKNKFLTSGISHSKYQPIEVGLENNQLKFYWV